MTNQITITGNVGGDPELRWTASGKAVCTFSIADGHRKKQGDQWVDDGTTWWRVSVWDHLAEECANKITKGSKVVVSGAARNREYEKDGQTQRSLEVTAQEVSLPLPKFAPREQQPQGQFQRPSQKPADDPWGAAPQQAFAPTDAEVPF